MILSLVLLLLLWPPQKEKQNDSDSDDDDDDDDDASGGGGGWKRWVIRNNSAMLQPVRSLKKTHTRLPRLIYFFFRYAIFL